MDKKNRIWDITKKVVKFLLFFGIGILFIYLSMKDLTAADKQQIRDSIKEVKTGGAWIFLALSFAIGVVADFLRSERNRLLLQPMGYNIRHSMAFYSVMVCYLANLAFPRLGEVLRCSFLQRYEKVPFQKSLGTVVTERAVDFIFLLAVLGSAILLNTNVLSQLKIDNQGTSLGAFLSQMGYNLLHGYKMYIILGILVICCIVVHVTRRWWNRIVFFQKVKHFFIGFGQGLLSIKDLRHPWLFIFYSFAIWIAYFLQTYVCFYAFDFLVGFDALMVFLVFAFANLGFIIGPGGLGVYPLIVAGMLVLYGYDYNAGLAAGWVGWSVQTLMVLSLGAFSLIAVSFMKRTSEIEETNNNI